MFLGIDIGSLSCDAVLIDEDGQTVAWSVVPTGARNLEAITAARTEVLARAGVDADHVSATVATGYGRNRVEGRLTAVTEITCHARGIRALRPEVRLLVDIGGQDSKAILLSDGGGVMEFAMNDKCAAGTGRFLEAMARALQLEIHQLGQLDRESQGGLTLSSMCTVFAESEVVSLIAEGTEVAEIVAALHRSVAARTAALVRRIAPAPADLEVAMSGGVARNPGVVRAITAALGCGSVFVPEEPDIVGALGAALIARKRA